MRETESAIWVEITKTRGSAPRDAGTVMKVTPTESKGTIGGGALEFAAIAKARTLLAQGIVEQTETIPLGPNLGQCCGGAVTLRYSSKGRRSEAPQPATQLRNLPDRPLSLWVWGAGHVGRAVVDASPPAAFDITWIDAAPERFPPHIPAHVRKTPASDMPLLAARAPAKIHHLIFTYSHEIDLGLCAALLKRDAASIGLIGSKTKRARFFKRLRQMNHDPSPIICPIGDKSLGKHPDQIAHGALHALLSATKSKALT